MRVPLVTFRVDARLTAGGGHMRRCLALAQALKPRCELAFALEPENAAQWAGALSQAGFAAVGDAVTDVAVLDGYAFGADEIRTWRRLAETLVMIEDFGRRFDGVDLYVSLASMPPAAGRALAGPTYALLDPGYASPVTLRPQGVAESVLIACGLRDSADLAGLYLDALAAVPEMRDMRVTIVMGEDAPHREAVAARSAACRARLLTNANDLRPLYDESDLILGAGGVSLFERMARGRASVTIVAAENQAAGAEAAARLGATRLLGPAGSVTVEMVAAAIRALAGDSAVRAAMGQAGRRTVDGRGAERVAAEILALAHRAPVAAVTEPGLE